VEKKKEISARPAVALAAIVTKFASANCEIRETAAAVCPASADIVDRRRKQYVPGMTALTLHW